MRALVHHEYGDADVVRVEEIATPAPAVGEVLVKVRASSVNDFDWGMLTGRPYFNRLLGGGRPSRPRYEVLGSDVSGVVEAVGAGASSFSPGDEVMGDMSAARFGAFAEYVKAPVEVFAAKPASLTFEQAATVPQAGVLAVVGLRGCGGVRSGQKVLINGAGGGVGSFAVQIAKAFGAEVTGVDIGHKLDLVRSLGAEHVLDYTAHDFTRTGDRYDVILDMESHQPLHAYLRSLRPGGRCALIGGSMVRVFTTAAVAPLVTPFAGKKVGVPLWKANKPEDVDFISRMLADGSVVPAIDRVFPLAEGASALRYFGDGRHRGKVVIVP